MSLFQRLGRAPASTDRQQPQYDPRQKLQELQAHPASTLAQAGLQIPEDMTDAQQIINYLLETKQISQSVFGKAFQMFGGMGRR